ncbi:hypothetical protein pb186bvf_009887 [Paramecium bursaria]
MPSQYNLGDLTLLVSIIIKLIYSEDQKEILGVNDIHSLHIV